MSSNIIGLSPIIHYIPTTKMFKRANALKVPESENKRASWAGNAKDIDLEEKKKRRKSIFNIFRKSKKQESSKVLGLLASESEANIDDLDPRARQDKKGVNKSDALEGIDVTTHTEDERNIYELWKNKDLHDDKHDDVSKEEKHKEEKNKEEELKKNLKDKLEKAIASHDESQIREAIQAAESFKDSQILETLYKEALQKLESIEEEKKIKKLLSDAISSENISQLKEAIEKAEKYKSSKNIEQEFSNANEILKRLEKEEETKKNLIDAMESGDITKLEEAIKNAEIFKESKIVGETFSNASSILSKLKEEEEERIRKEEEIRKQKEEEQKRLEEEKKRKEEELRRKQEEEAHQKLTNFLKNLDRKAIENELVHFEQFESLASLIADAKNLLEKQKDALKEAKSIVMSIEKKPLDDFVEKYKSLLPSYDIDSICAEWKANRISDFKNILQRAINNEFVMLIEGTLEEFKGIYEGDEECMKLEKQAVQILEGIEKVNKLMKDAISSRDEKKILDAIQEAQKYKSFTSEIEEAKSILEEVKKQNVLIKRLEEALKSEDENAIKSAIKDCEESKIAELESIVQIAKDVLQNRSKEAEVIVLLEQAIESGEESKLRSAISVAQTLRSNDKIETLYIEATKIMEEIDKENQAKQALQDAISKEDINGLKEALERAEQYKHKMEDIYKQAEELLETLNEEELIIHVLQEAIQSDDIIQLNNAMERAEAYKNSKNVQKLYTKTESLLRQRIAQQKIKSDLQDAIASQNIDKLKAAIEKCGEHSHSEHVRDVYKEAQELVKKLEYEEAKKKEKEELEKREKEKEIRKQKEKEINEKPLDWRRIESGNIKYICECLEGNHGALKKLVLPGKQLGNSKVERIMKVLENNTVLEYLDIQDNNFDDEAVPAICEMLKKNKTLRTLEMDGNYIMQQGISQLIEALKVNEYLTEIGVGKFATDEEIDAIEDLMDRNYDLNPLD